MLNLDNVTLLGIDCINIERLIFAAEVSLKKIQFKEVKLLTHLKSNNKHIVKIPQLSSIEAYSEFMIKELVNYVDTDYVLIIQHDGFVLNANKWDDDFFKFDYIGAPCAWGMGNGGFSFRSRKLLTILANESNITNTHPEDLVICKDYRPLLEQQGIVFATTDVAFDFGVEDSVWNGQFGFHNADISLWDIDTYANPDKDSFFIEKFKNSNTINNIKLTYIVNFKFYEDKMVNLNELIAIYSSYSKDLLDQIHFVFVDENTSLPISIEDSLNLNYTLIKIEDTIHFNEAGARNIGVQNARSENIILTESNVIFPEILLATLLNYNPPNNTIFKFHTTSGLKSVQPHFNVFFMNRDVFQRTNGYDEEFSGKYGYEDAFFYFLNKKLGVKFYLFRFSNIVCKKIKNIDIENSEKFKAKNKILFDYKMRHLETSINPLDVRSDIYLNFNWSISKENKMI